MTTIQLRHDTATNWTTVNPILAEGEVGVETDTNKFKIGDGATTWTNLAYQGSGGDLSNYYTKSETDTALSNKQDTFSVTAPLVMQEPSEPASPATTTSDDGVTFTVDGGEGYSTIQLSEGGATVSGYNSTLQLQTTENGNGIIDRTKTIVYDFEITETTDVEFRWASDSYGDARVDVPKILLGKNGNNGFEPQYTIGYNFSSTAPYENYLYIGEVGGDIAGNSDISSWTGTKYNCNTNSIGNIPLNYDYVNLVKVRLYSDNSDIKIDITVSSEDEGPYTQTFTLGSYSSIDTNCAVFMTTYGSQYKGANFGVFDTTTGNQKWNPAKTYSRSLLLNIDSTLIVNNNALGVNSNNYYTKSEITDKIGNLADLTTEDKTNLVAAINEAATKGGGGSTLFDFKWTDHQLNDIRFLRADTFSWQSGDVYVTSYNHLVQDIQGITAETETIGSYTVTFYRATDGHKICLADQEQTVLNIYNTYGIAWYYILDTTNTQFKLPRTKYGFEGLRTNVGDKIDESLPNITGNFVSETQRTNGAFSVIETFSSQSPYGTGASRGYLSFNAHRSNSIYQDNAPVQERATQMYLYFYVGDYTQSAVEQTAGLNAELFNGKADRDLANINNTGKVRIAHNASPSSTFRNLTLNASGSQYTAPADGYFALASTFNANGFLYMYRQAGRIGISLPYSSNSWTECNLKVSKGDVIVVQYSGTASVQLFRFYYDNGSESEAF